MLERISENAFSSSQHFAHSSPLTPQTDSFVWHVGAEALINLAFFLMPIATLQLVRIRRDLSAQHRRIAYVCSGFILLAGLTHLTGLISLWEPLPALQGYTNAGLALVAGVTSIFVWPLLPRFTKRSESGSTNAPGARLGGLRGAHPTSADLQAAKEALEEIEAHRTKSLTELTRRFEAALEDSDITVFEQNHNLEYTWLCNSPIAADGLDFIGRKDHEVFPPEAAEHLTALKREVLETGDARTTEICVPVHQGKRWYRVNIRPLEGDEGVIATGTDITAAKENEARQHLLMRELAHRTKNLIAVIAGIVRQTARGRQSVDEFQSVLTDRLGGLAKTHDLLISADWGPLDLDQVISSQMATLVDGLKDRIRVEGPALKISGMAAQHVGLAVHELTTNALKHGALKSADGQIQVCWEICDDAPEKRITLTWRELCCGPFEEPTSAGFGTFLTTTAIETGLRGKVLRQFLDDGFLWQIDFPAGAADDDHDKLTGTRIAGP